MLAFFGFPPLPKTVILDAWKGTFSVFFCFLWILQFWELGSKKGGKIMSLGQKNHLLFEVIFGTFATLRAACFSGVFLEVTFPHFL